MTWIRIVLIMAGLYYIYVSVRRLMEAKKEYFGDPTRSLVKNEIGLISVAIVILTLGIAESDHAFHKVIGAMISATFGVVLIGMGLSTALVVN